MYICLDPPMSVLVRTAFLEIPSWLFDVSLNSPLKGGCDVQIDNLLSTWNLIEILLQLFQDIEE